MKKLLFIFAAVISLVAYSINTYADGVVKIYKNGSCTIFYANEVDSVVFAPYNSNDDDNETFESLRDIFIGTWYNEENGVFAYFQFKADGTYIEVEHDEEEEKGYHVRKGKWSISNDKLLQTATWSSLFNDIFLGVTLTYDIIKAEKNELMFSLWGIAGTLKRVSDDAIEKYLE